MTRFIFFPLIAAGTLAAQITGPGMVNNPGQGRPVSTPAFVNGKVVLEDGTPAPEHTVIRADCGRGTVDETHTDKKGRFSLAFGNFSAAPAGWNAFEKQGSRDELTTCDLSVSSPGYRTLKVTAHSGDIGLLVLKPVAARDGYTVSINNALAPPEAKASYDRALQSIAKGKLADARTDLSKAVEIYPKYASAWLELGKLQMDAKEPDEARRSFLKSLEADPKYLPPNERLATLALREQNWRELADRTGALIDLGAYEYLQAYYYNAVANLALNRLDAAEKSAREALKQDTAANVGRGHYVLGMILVRRGDLATGLDELRAYLASGPPAAEADVVRKMLVEMEKRAEQAKVNPPKS